MANHKVKCSFAQWLIDNLGSESIEKYWSYQNTINPFDISYESKVDIWIKCTNNNHPDYKTKPYCFISGKRCPVCCNNKIIKGINDIGTLRPDLIQYFENKSEVYIYGPGSNQYTNFICPTCKEKYRRRISHVADFGLSCKKCGDHISYPNKFIYELLTQLQNNNNFSIYPEHIFEWSKYAICDYNNSLSGEKRYDFVVTTNNATIIIENHGMQHYDDNNFFNKNHGSEHDNDVFKHNLAIHNHIDEYNYIVLDCRYSNVDWIKKSVMNSQLPIIFNFTINDIDWDKCVLATKKNYVEVVINIWNNGFHDLSYISENMGVSVATVRRLLRIGSKCGLCDYGNNVQKPILCLDNGYVFLYSKSLMDNAEIIFGQTFSQDYISKQARKNGNNKKGIHLTYISREEFKQIKEFEPWRVYE